MTIWKAEYFLDGMSYFFDETAKNINFYSEIEKYWSFWGLEKFFKIGS
ncbi:hypothetical protein SAMN04488522_10756 [Pedobacter caeni]|uniref:Uncharacterized protein n=1 Tax=Pedobacter caeni TaxID=288992 RepID=A0A1M5M423_9SPHI|nr:hypothetical protein SAMN04488522_10756 [Pedobacter caeni]